MNPKILFSLVILVWIAPAVRGAEQASPTLSLTDPETIFMGEGTSTFSMLAGAHFGFEALGGRETHDMAMMSLSYGRVLTTLLGEGYVWRGNLEVRGELFAGLQYSPETDWVLGLAPHLRYNFVTGSRFIPFVDAGAGVTATGIGPPDLSGTFEFNLQAGAGLHWFLKEDLALTAEARYMHLSCAGMSDPNLGVNGVIGLLGLTWLF